MGKAQGAPAKKVISRKNRQGTAVDSGSGWTRHRSGSNLLVLWSEARQPSQSSRNRYLARFPERSGDDGIAAGDDAFGDRHQLGRGHQLLQPRLRVRINQRGQARPGDDFKQLLFGRERGSSLRFADWLAFATKVDGARVNGVLLLLFWERM